MVLIDDDPAVNIPHIFLPSSGDHDTLVFGSGYTYRQANGAAGDDTFIVTRHQVADVSIDDALGQNTIKFDDGVTITHVDPTIVSRRGRTITTEIDITLDTGAVINIPSPNSEVGGKFFYYYQLGDGHLMSYDDFITAITAGGFKNDAQGDATTELNTPLVIVAEPATLSSPASNATQFTIPTLPSTVTEGNDLTFTLTPSSALTGAVTVRWEVILEGRLSASVGDFPDLSGTVSFLNGATTAQTITINIRDDNFYGENRSFSIRLIEVAADGTETQIGTDHSMVLIDDDPAVNIPHIFLPSSGDHDTLVFGSGYTYRQANGAAGDDTFIVTRHQVADVSIDDALGQNTIKFDDGVTITHVDPTIVSRRGRTITTEIDITLDTGAVINIPSPNSEVGGKFFYYYQLGDGHLMSYDDFITAITAGGFKNDAQGDATTELNTPLVIVAEPATVTPPPPPQPDAPQLELSQETVTLAEGDLAKTELATLSIANGTIGDYTFSVSDPRFAVESGKLVLLAATFDAQVSNTITVTVTATKGSDILQQSFTVNFYDLLPDTGNYYLRWVNTGESVTNVDGTTTTIESESGFDRFDMGSDNVRGTDDRFSPAPKSEYMPLGNMILLDDRVPELTSGSITVNGLNGDDVYIIKQGFNSNDVIIDEVVGKNIIVFGENVKVTAVTKTVLPGHSDPSEARFTIDTDTTNSDTTDTITLIVKSPETAFMYYDANDATPLLEDLNTVINDIA